MQRNATLGCVVMLRCVVLCNLILYCTAMCCDYLNGLRSWDALFRPRCLLWDCELGLGLGALGLCGVSTEDVRVSVRASTAMTASFREGYCTVLVLMFGGRHSMLDLETGSTVRP